MPQLSRLSLVHGYVLSVRNAWCIACRRVAVLTMAKLRFTRVTRRFNAKNSPEERTVPFRTGIRLATFFQFFPAFQSVSAFVDSRV